MILKELCCFIITMKVLTFGWYLALQGARFLAVTLISTTPPPASAHSA